jgi:hypothetical protein
LRQALPPASTSTPSSSRLASHASASTSSPAPGSTGSPRTLHHSLQQLLASQWQPLHHRMLHTSPQLAHGSSDEEESQEK